MKKILFTLVLLALATVNSLAQEGEIIYNDSFEPREMHADEPWPDNIRLLDFDSDSIKDFFIAWTQYREWHVIAYTYDNWWFEKQVLEVGDTISAVYGWFPTPMDPDYDPIIQFQPGYSRDSIIVGVKKQVDEEDFCYGWIRFSLDAGPMWIQNLPNGSRVPWAHGICTFIDYAYCTQPNYPLLAGQTCFNWSIGESATESFASLYPNPTNSLVTITGENLRQAEVLNMLGQMVLIASGKGNEITIDLGKLSAGVYLVNVTDEEGKKCVRKVVRE